MEAENNISCSDGHGVNGLQVHIATLVDRFRDACRTGDLESIQHITKDMPDADMLQLIHQPGYPGHEGHHQAVTGSPMFEAVLANRVDVVDYLAGLGYDLEHECDVHVMCPIVVQDRCTALCLACASGAVEVARVLLRHGANVNHVSQHSSPIIYASECKDVELASLLLDAGANICATSKGHDSYPAVLPLYQACINGHKDTAELFLRSTRDSLSLLKRVGFLGLLGAQRINRHSDFTAGVGYWRQALLELRQIGGIEQADDLSVVLQRITLIDGQVPVAEAQRPLKVTKTSQIFSNVRLCSSVEELESLVDDHSALVLQALLLLQTILGQSHPETLLQLSVAAHRAQDDRQLARACQLYVYAMDCSEASDKSDLMTDYSSQLAELLMNIHLSDVFGAHSSLMSIADVLELVEGAVEILCSSMSKLQMMLFPRCSITPTSPPSGTTDSKLHSRVRLFTEMVETLMAFLRLFTIIETGTSAAPSSSAGMPPPSVNYQVVCGIVTRLLALCHATTPVFSKFSVESEMMKIAVHGDHSTLSTLYFFQEELFPDVSVLRLLLRCAASVNCRDFQGDTPLHHAIDCRHPNSDIIRLLLDSGAHVDTCNRSGMTPERLLRCCGLTIPHGVDLFDLVTLRCLAAHVVVDAGLEYRGGVLPPALETFLRLHSAPDIHHSVAGLGVQLAPS